MAFRVAVFPVMCMAVCTLNAIKFNYQMKMHSFVQTTSTPSAVKLHDESRSHTSGNVV